MSFDVPHANSPNSSKAPSSFQAVEPIYLSLKERLSLPLEVDALSPDILSELSQDEIGKLPVFQGHRQYQLSDFFKVDGERSLSLEMHGDLAQVKWIGKGMTCGSIAIHGNAGMHLGSAMKGGSIVVHGNTGDWLGAEMSGGMIRVRGNAGGQVGAAYRGSRKGMKSGVILIDGMAGIEVGMLMRRGLICVQGRVGDFAGLQMLGGTLFLCGKVGIRTGAWMSRGTIAAFKPMELLPTFQYSCTYEPAFLKLLIKQLRKLGVSLNEPEWDNPVRRYLGDASGLGKGEILICSQA
jgi:formylmethanofuran dehydrogenase subunit C